MWNQAPAEQVERALASLVVLADHPQSSATPANEAQAELPFLPSSPYIMVANPSHTSLGLEYFVQEGDELWNGDDESLIELATCDCATLGFIDKVDVIDGVVIRMPRAYPV